MVSLAGAAPELLGLRLQDLAAGEQVVVMQQRPVQPALHLAGSQSLHADSLLGGMDAAHMRAGLQSLVTHTYTFVAALTV